MPHVEINSISPLPDDNEEFGIVDFQVEKYPLSSDIRHDILVAFYHDGVVAETEHGWLVFSTDLGVRAASSVDLNALPRLPGYWHNYAINALMTDQF